MNSQPDSRISLVILLIDEAIELTDDSQLFSIDIECLCELIRGLANIRWQERQHQLRKHICSSESTSTLEKMR
jgi:hypothetical protein